MQIRDEPTNCSNQIRGAGIFPISAERCTYAFPLQESGTSEVVLLQFSRGDSNRALAYFVRLQVNSKTEFRTLRTQRSLNWFVVVARR